MCDLCGEDGSSCSEGGAVMEFNKGEVVKMYCLRCKKEVFVKDFRDGAFLRFYMQSGVCQGCQDKEIKEENAKT